MLVTVRLCSHPAVQPAKDFRPLSSLRQFRAGRLSLVTKIDQVAKEVKDVR